MQDPGPFFRGSHKGSYGTLGRARPASAAPRASRTWAARGAPTAAATAAPPHPVLVPSACAGCGVGVPQGRRGLIGTCSRRRRHLPRASGGHQPPRMGRLSFPQHGLWDPGTALGRERRAQGLADLGGPRRADPALVYRGDCRTTARAVRSCPARLIAPVDVVSAVDGAGGVGCSLRPRRPSHLEGSVTHWPKSSNRRREFINRTRRLRRLIRELFRRLIRELFRRSREFRSSSDHGTGARADGRAGGCSGGWRHRVHEVGRQP